ncbi:MAG: hypothetical protein QM582_18425 [Micropruina sp.]|uniref:O-antigen ligase family protein n=1 Tax=Micropruina sp. TaxID=2737536 RepID=UPI0039E59572
MLVVPRAERPFAKGPYLAMLVAVVATEPWRPATYFEGSFDGVVIAKALLSVVAAITAWYLVSKRPRLGVPAWPTLLVALYLSITVFGGWAEGVLLSSLIIAVRVLILVGIVNLLLSGYDGYSVMAGLVGALVTVAVVSALTGGLRASDGRLAGGIPPLHPNEIAAISAMGILWLLYRAVNGRENAVDLVMLAVAGTALVASGSRTSLVMVLPAAAILVFTARRFHLRVLIPFVLSLPVIAFTVFFSDAITGALTREGSSEDIGSLSNRTIAWQSALMPKSSAWLTWAGGGLTLKRIEVPGQWWSHQILDSSWVSALVQGGYLGVATCLVLILYGLYRVARVPGELRGFRLALILFLALRGVLESGLFDASTAFLTCFTALALPDVSRARHPVLAPLPDRHPVPSFVWQPPHSPIPGENVRSIKKRLLVAGNLLALGLVVAGLVNFFAPRSYQSSAALYATAAGTQLRATDIYQGTMMVSARMATYVELATSPVVLNGVIEELRLDEGPNSLAERVHATNPGGTTVLVVTATDSDPARAQLIAATVASRFNQAVTGLESGAEAAPQVNFRAVEPAQAPTEPKAPDRLRNLAIGGGIGAGLGLIVLLWPLVRIASSPDGQLRLILLGPMADRLDASAVRIVGEVESAPQPAVLSHRPAALTTGAER